MKSVTGSITASTSWKVPMRMPSGTARTDASPKPTKTTKQDAAMWVQREPSFRQIDGRQHHLRSASAGTPSRTKPLCASSTHPARIAPTVSVLAVR